MKHIFHLLAFLILHHISFACANDTLSVDSISTFCYHPPRYPGGDAALVLFIFENFDSPEIQWDESPPPSTLIFELTIEKDGGISEIRMLNPDNGSYLEGSFTEAFRKMAKWSCGKDENNSPVRCQVKIPLKIKLQ